MRRQIIFAVQKIRWFLTSPLYSNILLPSSPWQAFCWLEVRVLHSPQVFNLYFSSFKTYVCITLGGSWVRSILKIWSCPTGYRPSYFVLGGGKGVGRSIIESQLSCSVAPPPARQQRIGGVRAQSCLPDPSAVMAFNSLGKSAKRILAVTFNIYLLIDITCLNGFCKIQIVLWVKHFSLA